MDGECGAEREGQEHKSTRLLAHHSFLQSYGFKPNRQSRFPSWNPFFRPCHLFSLHLSLWWLTSDPFGNSIGSTFLIDPEPMEFKLLPPEFKPPLSHLGSFNNPLNPSLLLLPLPPAVLSHHIIVRDPLEM